MKGWAGIEPTTRERPQGALPCKIVRSSLNSQPLTEPLPIISSLAMRPNALPRLAFRQSRWALQRRTASSTTEAVTQTANKAKENVSEATSKASQGLSRVTSSAGNVLSSASNATANALSGVGGRTGRAIGFVQGSYAPSRCMGSGH